MRDAFLKASSLIPQQAFTKCSYVPITVPSTGEYSGELQARLHLQSLNLGCGAGHQAL